MAEVIEDALQRKRCEVSTSLLDGGYTTGAFSVDSQLVKSSAGIS